MDIVQNTSGLNQMDEEAIKNAFRAKGKKLGLLLSGANIPQEVKEALVTIVPELSLDQIDGIITALEGNYARFATGAADAEKQLQEKLKSIIGKYNARADAAAAATTKAIEQLAKKIPA